MNKVLVTGLGTAKDLDMCEACGLNFSWLIDNPSTILWADQICIPQNAYEIAKAQSERKDERVISMFLNMVENQGIIKPIDLSRMYPKSLGNEIKKKMLEDSQTLLNRNINKRFPKIQRWTKMTTVLATPITIASAITGNIPLTIGGAVATGIAQATENLLEVYKSKNNWVGFINSMKNI